ncbi:hypothetical protein ACFO1B_00905 [Dactylosporangium siamense]|uniref:PH domain-containing protein n=1 Tax=Dactylosporangium siamense TaxID=685454 RepID=A0A919PC83_9ACTN|nr:hypothetical protein [Dactylosporangium siamense]GIG42090.1 hypothetical protein Dsi01nite_001310 [Dactylosporangium siamense]
MTNPQPPSWRGAPPAPRRQIPGDLPFVVRRSAGRLSVSMGSVFALIWALLTGQLAFGLLAGESQDRTGGDVVAVVVGGFCAAVIFAVAALIVVRIILSNGPVLALDHSGLWIKNSQAVWGKAVWIPWESVERVARRRFLGARMIAVFAGRVRYLAPLRLNDRTESEILGALAQFGGRSVLEPRDQPS